MTDFGDYDSDAISKESWFKLLEAWCLAHSERKSNLIIIVPSTPGTK